MNTNYAPERIELPNGWRFKLADQKSQLYKLISADDYFFGMWNLTDAGKLAAAMQPQVSESNEAVAREIVNALLNSPESHDVETVTAILARHRQPAAVKTQSAAEIASNIQRALVAEGVHVSPSVRIKCILPYVGQPAAMSADAVEIANAVRLSFENTFDAKWDEKQAAKHVQSYGDQRELNGARKIGTYEQWAFEGMGRVQLLRWIREKVFALSPATVCGGENHG